MSLFSSDLCGRVGACSRSTSQEHSDRLLAKAGIRERTSNVVSANREKPVYIHLQFLRRVPVNRREAASEKMDVAFAKNSETSSHSVKSDVFRASHKGRFWAVLVHPPLVAGFIYIIGLSSSHLVFA